MKTYFQIIADNSYQTLTPEQKDMIQDRQTELVVAWQDTRDEDERYIIEEELMASFNGLIKGLAHMNAEKSFSVEKEDFEGLISLTFAETLFNFDRTLGKPFQPVFIMRVKYAVLEMYRAKGYDLHDTTERLDRIVGNTGVKTLADLTEASTEEIEESVNRVHISEIVSDLFGHNSKKKTIIAMTMDGYKRSEIVEAIREEGKSTDSLAKMVNRTVSQFKEHYVNLTNANLI